MVASFRHKSLMMQEQFLFHHSMHDNRLLSGRMFSFDELFLFDGFRGISQKWEFLSFGVSFSIFLVTLALTLDLDPAGGRTITSDKALWSTVFLPFYVSLLAFCVAVGRTMRPLSHLIRCLRVRRAELEEDDVLHRHALCGDGLRNDDAVDCEHGVSVSQSLGRMLPTPVVSRMRSMSALRHPVILPREQEVGGHVLLGGPLFLWDPFGMWRALDYQRLLFEKPQKLITALQPYQTYRGLVLICLLVPAIFLPLWAGNFIPQSAGAAQGFLSAPLTVGFFLMMLLCVARKELDRCIFRSSSRQEVALLQLRFRLTMTIVACLFLTAFIGNFFFIGYPTPCLWCCILTPLFPVELWMSGEPGKGV